jgi:hypothetical protein
MLRRTIHRFKDRFCGMSVWDQGHFVEAAVLLTSVQQRRQKENSPTPATVREDCRYFYEPPDTLPHPSWTNVERALILLTNNEYRMNSG